jgi:hypothetical protein
MEGILAEGTVDETVGETHREVVVAARVRTPRGVRLDPGSEETARNGRDVRESRGER